MISSKPFFEYLAEYKITQKAFCEKAGCDKGKLRNLREGRISANTLDLICKTLDINIEDILRYEED